MSWLPTDPEARGYLLILAGTVLILIGALALAGWYAGVAGHARRARRRAAEAHTGELIELSRRATRAELDLAAMRSRYGADVNEHFDRGPRWTRPGPPADQTVIIAAVEETGILTAAGVSLADPT